MSLSLSGSSLQARQARFEVTEGSATGEARRFAAVLMQEAGFAAAEKSRAAIVINEIGSNLLNHVGRGEILISLRHYDGGLSVEILGLDAGGGIANLSNSLEDGFSTGRTPGTGLGAIRRQSDLFDICSGPKGTAVLSIIYSDKGVLPSAVGFEVGAVSIPVRGESVCGDGWSLKQTHGLLRILVGDGLGHGVLAHEAVRQAQEIFSQGSDSLSLEMQMQTIHKALRGTRGSGITLLELSRSDNVIKHLGLGNVRSVIFAGPHMKTFVTYPGTLGLQYKPAKELTFTFEESSLLVIHSDGLTAKWSFDEYPGLATHHPALIAAVLFRDFKRENDDATVLVLRRAQ